MNSKLILPLLLILLIFSCQPKQDPVDTILVNAKVYTANDAQPTAEAVAVKDGKIIKVGKLDDILAFRGDSTQVLNLNGHFVYPGFIEGHAHIMGVGANLVNVDLMGAQSYSEVVDMVKKRAEETPEGTWIIGRGWHQDKWSETPETIFKGFPTHHELSEAVPNHPVYLSHASGHASLVNAKALELAGINKDTPDPNGGEVFKDVTGQPTGLLNETASRLVAEKIPEETKELKARKLQLAIDECLKNGIVGLHQAGSRADDIEVFEEFAAEEELKIRLHVMLSGMDTSLLKAYYEKGPQIGLYDNHLNIRSIKLYADGALGSRGAWLLEEYSDAHGVHGHNVTPMEDIEEVVFDGLANGFQMCTHAIGDRANREVLDIYERAFGEFPEQANDSRFRIEHAQHIHPEDIPRFAELGVIPAMQAIHMSSDRPWAIDRLGKERIENGAYMWSELIDNGSKIVNGTDAPVEPVSALASFYASVSRKTLKGNPEGGYEPGQKMTREEALKSYTIWPAYGAFMEDITGTIEEGKIADFTVLDKDIMTVPDEEILTAQVKMTIIDGKVVFEK
ncbi:amidohydrolase [Marinoscillum pacificum]|uniref:amidohydrolase n=1 Tax=Marinoscillum pacificum TaxID=392723 RepID=UPI0021575842|nr:amidohydrolase [Marinoscillum pacificum]